MVREVPHHVVRLPPPKSILLLLLLIVLLASSGNQLKPFSGWNSPKARSSPRALGFRMCALWRGHTRRGTAFLHHSSALPPQPEPTQSQYLLLDTLGWFSTYSAQLLIQSRHVSHAKHLAGSPGCHPLQVICDFKTGGTRPQKAKECLMPPPGTVLGGRGSVLSGNSKTGMGLWVSRGFTHTGVADTVGPVQ